MSYTDEDLSRQRLDLTKRTLGPSLAAQTEQGFTWVVAVNPSDPALAERLEYCRSVATVLPVGAGEMKTLRATLQTRVDDDDVLHRRFMETIHENAVESSLETTVIVPVNGYVFHGGKFYLLDHDRNQFATLKDVTLKRSVWERKHGDLASLAPVSYIRGGRLWVWVRHRLAKTGTADGYLSRPAKSQPRGFVADWP